MSDQDKQPSQEAPKPNIHASADPTTRPVQPESASAPAVPPEPDPAEIGRQTLFVNTGRPTGLTCPKCGHVNRPGVLVCENCGTLMVNEEQVTGTKRFESDRQEPDSDPKRNTSIETTEMISVAVSTAGTGTFSDGMVLRLEVEGAPTPLLLSPQYETSIGRRDPATGTQPDVDLSAYSGYRLGVSRKHAIIRLNNEQLEILDLGSSNGTSVNGARLVAHQPHPLRDGDEIRLGKMMIRVLFQARNRRK
ncbi:MAG: FHA domain-containing protein [Anaerolineae bacterium]|nr:FHA domain-containing protein [Anaerolineae bacterium]